jgi:NAD(P)-dependent dehydrogenase (short-subunit alcohol dehydrogenase family)
VSVLAGETAIVTGGGRGFGRAVAETLAALGANVVVASRNAPQLDEVVISIRRARGRALAFAADVADERQVQELVLATERWVGPASIVVNNAGALEPMAPLVRTTASQWLRNVAVNVGGTYLLSRAVLPGMLDREHGRIINISSGAARKPSYGWTAYGAAKAAVDQLTRALALELEGTGVTACALYPGLMDTAMQERIRQASPEDVPRVEEFREAHQAGRVRDPREPARAVAYLALSQAAHNGDILEYGDPELERAINDALAGQALAFPPTGR